MIDLRNRDLAILGAGRSGAAAARLARREGALPTVFDTGSPNPAPFASEGIPLVTGDGAMSAPVTADLAVISPGIDLASPLARRFGDAGVKIIGELELGYHFARAPIVGITGTNGKTTTTELTAKILSGCGLRTEPAGNWGVPFCEILLRDKPTDIYTLEISSFQLEAVESFRCETAVWLNFAPDHLDRYPGMAEYRAAKMRIFERQTADDTAIVNGVEPPAGLAAKTVTFSAFREGCEYGFDGTHILFEGERVVDFTATRLRGAHNAENLMAALAAGRAQGLGYDEMAASVSDYRPPRHRCELAGIRGDNEFINDSKATNLHALATSLRALGAPVVLIAGGKDKGLPFGDLRDTVASRATHVVVIGEIRRQLAECWKGAVPISEAESVREAVAIAASVATPGQTVLFSPGTSSFDMFSGYEERGDAFCEAVIRLIEK